MSTAIAAIIFLLPAMVLFLLIVLLSSHWNKMIWLTLGVAIFLTFYIIDMERKAWFPVMSTLAAAPLIALFLACLLGFMARALWQRHRQNTSADASAANGLSPQEKKDSERANTVFVASIGTGIPLIAIVGGPFARLSGTTLFAFLAILLTLALFCSFRRTRPAFVPPAFARWFSASLLVALIFALYTGHTVWQAAKATASGAPYCIQSGNKTATNWLDTTVLNLRAPIKSNIYLNYHGLLVTGGETTKTFYNWSYKLGRFVPARMTYEPAAICVPT